MACTPALLTRHTHPPLEKHLSCCLKCWQLSHLSCSGVDRIQLTDLRTTRHLLPLARGQEDHQTCDPSLFHQKIISFVSTSSLKQATILYSDRPYSYTVRLSSNTLNTSHRILPLIIHTLYPGPNGDRATLVGYLS